MRSGEALPPSSTGSTASAARSSSDAGASRSGGACRAWARGEGRCRRDRRAKAGIRASSGWSRRGSRSATAAPHSPSRSKRAAAAPARAVPSPVSILAAWCVGGRAKGCCSRAAVTPWRPGLRLRKGRAGAFRAYLEETLGAVSKWRGATRPADRRRGQRRRGQRARRHELDRVPVPMARAIRNRYWRCRRTL